MKNYVTLELKVLVLEDEDVLTASADFVDSNEGDNGVWFPGKNPDSNEEAWQ